MFEAHHRERNSKYQVLIVPEAAVWVESDIHDLPTSAGPQGYPF
jgi:hypothetical protein